MIPFRGHLANLVKSRLYVDSIPPFGLDFERNYFALLCTLKTAWHGTMDIHRRSGYAAERRTPMGACQIPLGTVF